MMSKEGNIGKCPKCGYKIDSVGKRAYELRKEGYNWVDISSKVDSKSPLLLAKHYAKVNELDWPLKVGKALRRKL